MTPITKQKESPEFDQYAHSYAQLLDDPLRNRFVRDPLQFHRRKVHLIELLLKRFGVNPATQKWLDVGCGQGQLLELAGSRFKQAAGCDPSAVMLSSNPSFTVSHQPSPTELPFADASFDFVTAVCVFHHVHGQDRTLLTNEIRRVLAPGGLCCVIEHNPRNPVTRTIVRRCPVDVGAELLPAQSTIDLLCDSGLQPLATEYFLFIPESVFPVLGAAERWLRKIPFGGQYASLAQSPWL
jgi:ubiquinone/menaquinone biosynthesis C-methylase UbiE